MKSPFSIKAMLNTLFTCCQILEFGFGAFLKLGLVSGIWVEALRPPHLRVGVGASDSDARKSVASPRLWNSGPKLFLVVVEASILSIASTSLLSPSPSRRCHLYRSSWTLIFIITVTTHFLIMSLWSLSSPRSLTHLSLVVMRYLSTTSGLPE